MTTTPQRDGIDPETEVPCLSELFEHLESAEVCTRGFWDYVQFEGTGEQRRFAERAQSLLDELWEMVDKRVKRLKQEGEKREIERAARLVASCVTDPLA